MNVFGPTAHGEEFPDSALVPFYLFEAAHGIAVAEVHRRLDDAKPLSDIQTREREELAARFDAIDPDKARRIRDADAARVRWRTEQAASVLVAGDARDEGRLEAAIATLVNFGVSRATAIAYLCKPRWHEHPARLP